MAKSTQMIIDDGMDLFECLRHKTIITNTGWVGDRLIIVMADLTRLGPKACYEMIQEIIAGSCISLSDIDLVSNTKQQAAKNLQKSQDKGEYLANVYRRRGLVALQ